MIYIYTWTDGTELYHHGILGQKWGVRRYQNKDGSLTAAGQKRYGDSENLSKRQIKKQARKDYRDAKANATNVLNSERKKADDIYSEKMKEKNSKLKSINNKYQKRMDETDKYYNSKKEEMKSQMDLYKSNLDFFGEDSFLGSWEKASYSSLEQKFKDTEREQEIKREAIRMLRNEERSKVNSKYAYATAAARSERQAAYEDAGRKYMESIAKAKQEYKTAKKR